MDRRLILLRHGETEFNKARRMQGHLDTALSERGRQQAHSVAQLLTQYPIQRIISSDLQRAADTAQAVSQVLGVPITYDERLRETHLGEWQGKHHWEVDTDFPGARAIWRHAPSWSPPGGESRLEVARRALPVVEEQLMDWESGDILFVAHGGTISALTSTLLGFSEEQYPLLSGLGNTCWSQLTVRPALEGPGVQWYLDGWNVGVRIP